MASESFQEGVQSGLHFCQVSPQEIRTESILQYLEPFDCISSCKKWTRGGAGRRDMTVSVQKTTATASMCTRFKKMKRTGVVAVSEALYETRDGVSCAAAKTHLQMHRK